MPIELGKPRLVGLAARKAALEEQNKLATTREPLKLISPLECKERIGIVFDDSSSMGDIQNENARKGVEEFLRSCKPNQTSVAVFTMNDKQYTLTSDLPALAMLVDEIRSSGGTPMLTTINKISFQNLTRVIVFSDGEATDREQMDTLRNRWKIIKSQRKLEVLPIDTVFLGTANDYGYTFMKQLAEEFGGIFLHFDPSKSNFRTAFKYLAPVNRHLLADKSFVAQLEGR